MRLQDRSDNYPRHACSDRNEHDSNDPEPMVLFVHCNHHPEEHKYEGQKETELEHDALWHAEDVTGHRLQSMPRIGTASQQHSNALHITQDSPSA